CLPVWVRRSVEPSPIWCWWWSPSGHRAHRLQSRESVRASQLLLLVAGAGVARGVWGRPTCRRMAVGGSLRLGRRRAAECAFRLAIAPNSCPSWLLLLLLIGVTSPW
ncbi:MAG TPA: hypothetical protein QGF58_10270, partial [Myxococcota bacterium]|nr:hypothetical protein [Myxococcota bacterium]